MRNFEITIISDRLSAAVKDAGIDTKGNSVLHFAVPSNTEAEAWNIFEDKCNLMSELQMSGTVRLWNRKSSAALPHSQKTIFGK